MKTVRDIILTEIDELLHTRVVERVQFNFAVGPVTFKKTKTMPLTLNITTEQEVVVHLNPVTPKGHPAALDGMPTWAVVAGTVSLIPAVDGLSCTIVSPDSPESAQVLVSADADLGAGVDTITDTIAVNVAHQNAAMLGLAADAPTLKP